MNLNVWEVELPSEVQPPVIAVTADNQKPRRAGFFQSEANPSFRPEADQPLAGAEKNHPLITMYNYLSNLRRGNY